MGQHPGQQPSFPEEADPVLEIGRQLQGVRPLAPEEWRRGGVAMLFHLRFCLERASLESSKKIKQTSQ